MKNPMEGKKYSKPFQGYSPRPDNTLPLNEALNFLDLPNCLGILIVVHSIIPLKKKLCRD